MLPLPDYRHFLGLLCAVVFVAADFGMHMVARASVWGDRLGLAGSVQETLEVPVTGDGVLKAIIEARVIASGRRDRTLPTDNEAIWIRLSDLVLAGQEPDVLTNLCMSRVEVPKPASSYEKADGWQYSTSMGRHNIMEGLWLAAKANRDAAKAQRMARAALVMAVNDEAGTGMRFAVRCLSDSDGANLLKTSPDEFHALKAEIEKYATLRSDSFFEDQVRLAKRLDAMIAEDPKAQSVETYIAWMSDFEKLYPSTPDHPVMHQSFIRLFWKSCCLARSRGFGNAIPEAAEIASRLADKVRNDHVKRWLKQAVTLDGPIPKHSGYETVIADPHSDRWSKPPR